MTEIPGGFPKKVCPETFVSNHTGPIRLAEDQMQRLMRCIVMGKIVREIEEEEPKPDPAPGQVKVSGEGWVPPVDPPETYKQEYENCYRLWQAAVKDRAFLEKERNLNKDRICELEQEVKFLKSAEDTLRVQIKCLQSNLDAANDRAHMAEGRAYSLMCDYNRCKKEAELEVERLKAQVPKERACVILRPYGEYYELLMTPIIFGDRESAIKWAGERCLEVLE